jgi:hypothetical protein
MSFVKVTENLFVASKLEEVIKTTVEVLSSEALEKKDFYWTKEGVLLSPVEKNVGLKSIALQLGSAIAKAADKSPSPPTPVKVPKKSPKKVYKKRQVTHMSIDPSTVIAVGDAYQTVCKRNTKIKNDVTTDRQKVTCSLCLRVMRKTDASR